MIIRSERSFFSRERRRSRTRGPQQLSMHIASTYRQRRNNCSIFALFLSFTTAFHSSTLAERRCARVRFIIRSEEEKPEKKRRTMISAYDYSSEMRKMHADTNRFSYAPHKIFTNTLTPFAWFACNPVCLFLSQLHLSLTHPIAPIEGDACNCQSHKQSASKWFVQLLHCMTDA